MFDRIRSYLERRSEERMKKKLKKMKMKLQQEKEMEIIRRESLPDQVWQVTKSVKIKGRKGTKLLNLKMYDHRPDAKEIYEDFYEMYGGGPYAIKTVRGGQFHVKTEIIDGEPKVLDPEVLDGEASHTEKRKPSGTWKEDLLRNVLENDPDLARKWVSKMINDGSDDMDFEDKITKDVLKSDPSLRREFVRARIAASLGFSPDEGNGGRSEFDGIEQVLNIIERTSELLRKDDKSSMYNILTDLIRSGAISDIMRVIGNVTEPERQAAYLVPNQYAQQQVQRAPQLQPLPVPSGTPAPVSGEQLPTRPIRVDGTTLHDTKSRYIPQIPDEIKPLLKFVPVITKYIQAKGSPKKVADMLYKYAPRFAEALKNESSDEILNKIKPYIVYPKLKPHITVLFKNKKWIDLLIVYLSGKDDIIDIDESESERVDENKAKSSRKSSELQKTLQYDQSEHTYIEKTEDTHLHDAAVSTSDSVEKRMSEYIIDKGGDYINDDSDLLDEDDDYIDEDGYADEDDDYIDEDGYADEDDDYIDEDGYADEDDKKEKR